jgi:ATP-dependent DNA helicase RecG
VPTHEAALQVIRGLETEVNVFFRWPLFRLAEEMVARFRARNTSQEIRFELVRVDVPAYSETAFREALSNALIHRDYTAPGAIHVQWAEDQIEIFNPAGLPAGTTPDTLRTAPPRPRNPLLADAFRRAGIVERTGRGISQIFAEQLRYGHAPPDYGRSGEHSVVALLPGGAADLAFARYVVAQEQARTPLSLADLQVVTALREQLRLRTVDVATLLETTKAQARRHLVGMAERGLVEVHGGGPARTWHLTARVHHELRVCAAHIQAGTASWPRRPVGEPPTPGPPPSNAASIQHGGRGAGGGVGAAPETAPPPAPAPDTASAG